MSKIERIIEEMEEYIESCKAQPFSSNSKIIVNKDEIMELLTELRLHTPEEIKKYQSIIRNRDEILNKARADADALLQQTAIQTNELIDEHEIMQQAFLKADEIVQQANSQAQEIIDTATIDANNIRMGAIQYTDELLANIQQMIGELLEDSKVRYEGFYKSFHDTFEQIQENRRELLQDEENSEMEEYENYEGEDDSYQE